MQISLQAFEIFKTNQIILILSRHAENGIPPGLRVNPKFPEAERIFISPLTQGPIGHPGSIPGDGVSFLRINQKPFSTKVFLK